MARSANRVSPNSAVGFDFTPHTRWPCRDIRGRLDDLAHVDVDQVAIRFCQTRNSSRYGLLASLTPLRFSNGQRVSSKGGASWTIQPICDTSHRDMLYLLSFYLPRFLDHTFDEKLATVVHELWHISPQFDGDLRRHAGRCYAHGPSQQKYDERMHALAQQWLSLDPPAEVFEFLRYDFRQLVARHGCVLGQSIPTPSLTRAS
mgnify:CR=1 FL=1